MKASASKSSPLNKRDTLQKATQLMQNGSHAAALKEYLQLFAQDPSDWTIANAVGDLYLRLGQIEEGVDHFTELAERVASDGFTTKARALYRRILRVQPDNEVASSRVDGAPERAPRFESVHQQAARHGPFFTGLRCAGGCRTAGRRMAGSRTAGRRTGGCRRCRRPPHRRSPPHRRPPHRRPSADCRRRRAGATGSDGGHRRAGRPRCRRRGVRVAAPRLDADLVRLAALPLAQDDSRLAGSEDPRAAAAFGRLQVPAARGLRGPHREIPQRVPAITFPRWKCSSMSVSTETSIISHRFRSDWHTSASKPVDSVAHARSRSTWCAATPSTRSIVDLIRRVSALAPADASLAAPSAADAPDWDSDAIELFDDNGLVTADRPARGGSCRAPRSRTRCSRRPHGTRSPEQTG